MKPVISALYVHVPFCRSKCAYCAFYSEPTASPGLRRAYLNRLEQDALAAMSQLAPLHSLFIGGGTPTALAAPDLQRLLDLVTRLPRAAGCEVTCECNPESLTAAKAELLAAAGVNRVSLGIQSFNPTLRRRLGRRGDPCRVLAAVVRLRQVGIGNLGGDLIYAIPGQTLHAWRDDLERALDLGLRHLSTYALTLEEGTRLARGRMEGIGEDLSVRMWLEAERRGRSHGLRRYEISNLAVPGAECAHNLAIWHGAAYLGLGPAAASFDGRRRWTQPANLHAWLEGAEPEFDDLPAPQRAAELLAFGLRTCVGWTTAQFTAVTGEDALALRGPQLHQLAEAGLVALSSRRIRPTRRGLRFADAIARTLI